MSTLRVDTILGESGAERRGLMTYAIICDQKAYNEDGGSSTTGSWVQRDLNETIADPDNIVTVANNQFTLGAGTYLIEASAPAYRALRHIIRLYNVTGSSVVQYGQAAYSNTSGNVLNNAYLTARVTLTGNTAFKIEHRVGSAQTTTGWGIDTSFSDSVSIYTVVKIFKEA